MVADANPPTGERGEFAGYGAEREPPPGEAAPAEAWRDAFARFGETRAYVLDILGGQYVHVEVDKGDLELEISVCAPQPRPCLKSVARRYGKVDIPFVADVSGAWSSRSWPERPGGFADGGLPTARAAQRARPIANGTSKADEGNGSQGVEGAFERAGTRLATAGTVFVGEWSPVAAGDYATGGNHVLPTNGWARSVGGLGLETFLKPLTVQRLTREGLERIAPTVEALAEAEELPAHAEAVRARLDM